jgi:hypothetical protein
MALLDFMKQGTQWLTDNTGMDWNKVQSDPGMAAKRLMGGPVDLSNQQGTGFGNPFNSLLGNGSNNISKEAVSPLSRMDVTGTVGGQSMTPYQSQEIAPSHLGAVTQDFSEGYRAPLPGGGSYNSYDPYLKSEYGTNKRIINNTEPFATGTGRERTRFANDERVTEENSDAKVGFDELAGKIIPEYNLTTNSFADGLEVNPWQGTLSDFDDTNFSGTEQILAGNTPIDTSLFNEDLLGVVESGTEAERKAKAVQNTINNKANTTYKANKELGAIEQIAYQSVNPPKKGSEDYLSGEAVVANPNTEDNRIALTKQQEYTVQMIMGNPETSPEEKEALLEQYNINPNTYLVPGYERGAFVSGLIDPVKK